MGSEWSKAEVSVWDGDEEEEDEGSLVPVLIWGLVQTDPSPSLQCGVVGCS